MIPPVLVDESRVVMISQGYKSYESIPFKTISALREDSSAESFVYQLENIGENYLRVNVKGPPKIRDWFRTNQCVSPFQPEKTL